MEDKVINITYTDDKNMVIAVYKDYYKNEKMMDKQIERFIFFLSDYSHNKSLIRVNDFFQFKDTVGVTYISVYNIRTVEVMPMDAWAALNAEEQELMEDIQEVEEKPKTKRKKKGE